MDEEVAGLMDRMKKIEGQNKWMRVGFLVMCVGLVVFFVVDAGNVPEEIRAKKFIVVDEKGKSRGGLGVSSDGPGLFLHDENGRIRAGLSASSAGPGLGLHDENEKLRALLSVTSEVTGLGLYDKNGKELFRDP